MNDDQIPDALANALVLAGIRGFRVQGHIERRGSRLWRGTGEIDGRSRDLFVKAVSSLRAEDESVSPRQERVKREFETLKRLHRALAPWPDLSVPEPIACLPECSALALETRKGETLKGLIERRARSLAGWSDWEPIVLGVRRVGKWLALVQDLFREPDERLDPGQLIAYNEVR